MPNSNRAKIAVAEQSHKGYVSKDDYDLYQLDDKVRSDLDALEAGISSKTVEQWKRDFKEADSLYRKVAHLDSFGVTRDRWMSNKMRYCEWEKQNGMGSIFNVLQIDWEKFKPSTLPSDGKSSETSGDKSGNSSEGSIIPTAEKSSFVFTEPKAPKGS